MAEVNKKKPMELRGFQRKYLRGLAHGKKPVVQIGREGVTDGVISAVEQALLTHELIKVRMYEPEDKRHTAKIIAERTLSHLCGLVGHQVILYRPHPEAPKIKVPKRQSSSTAGT